MAYATADNVAAVWRPLCPDEQAVATNLCATASRFIDADFPDVAGRVAASPSQAELVADIVAQVVKRAMLNSDREGIESQSETAGPFSRQQKYANPDGALYLTQAERDRLGVAVAHRSRNGWLA